MYASQMSMYNNEFLEKIHYHVFEKRIYIPSKNIIKFYRRKVK